MPQPDPTPLESARRLQQEGKFAQAEPIFRQWLQKQPSDIQGWNDLGVCLGQQSKFDGAMDAFKRAIQIQPEHLASYRNLALVYEKRNDLDHAAEVYRAAVSRFPTSVPCLESLGILLARLDQMNDAVACFAAALKLEPQSRRIAFHLGKALVHAEQIDAGIDLLQQVLKIEPANVEVHYELALALRRANRHGDALVAVEKLLEISPNHNEGLGTRALLLLALGDYQRGWREYEHRWNSVSFTGKKRETPPPEWAGEDLTGRTILLYTEQGYGDAIQFIRYVPLLAKRGAKVLLETSLDLLPLFRNVEGLTSAFTPTGHPPKFDFHCPLLSLPGIFQTTRETIPAQVPYLWPAQNLTDEWTPRLVPYADNLKVGIVWGGNVKPDKYRAAKLEHFAPLAGLPNIKLFTLQKGSAAAQAIKPPPGMNLINFTASISHFGDTAALISHLDLIVTIDTAVAHLAGAMGKRVFTLLPFAPDWRWLPDSKTTPWYPTMKLFRQYAPGNWAEVISRVMAEISLYSPSPCAQGEGRGEGSSSVEARAPIEREEPSS
jgi:cytochrome c-type biogenesis protein CcmH/NrfG